LRLINKKKHFKAKKKQYKILINIFLKEIQNKLKTAIEVFLLSKSFSYLLRRKQSDVGVEYYSKIFEFKTI